MELPDVDAALNWRGRKVLDQAGDELGKLTDLYLDSQEQRPAWAGVKRGLVRQQETIVPLAGAREEEGAIRLAHDRATVEAAPDVDPDVELTQDEERTLHEHYGREWAPPSGTVTDTAMTRSEEEVQVGTRVRRHAERIRLRKVLVQDEVTKTVPVRKEVIRLETDPPPEGRIESVEDAGEEDVRRDAGDGEQR